MSDDRHMGLEPLSGERGEYTFARAQLAELGLWELHLLQWALVEAVAARPDLQVQVSESLQDGSITVRWRPRK